LDRIIEWRGKPGTVRVDTGPAYISETLLKRAEKQGVTILHIQPGQPRQNACIKRCNRVRHRARTDGACNGSLRQEWLDQYSIESIEEAQDHATQWRWTCNNDRPNMGIGGITSAQKTENGRISSTNAPRKKWRDCHTRSWGDLLPGRSERPFVPQTYSPKECCVNSE